MPAWRARVITVCALLIATLLAALPAHAAASLPAPLTLRDGVAINEAWPSVTLLFDDKKTMTIADAMAARSQFTLPASPYATLGVRTDAAWLRVPMAVVAASDGHWVLDIDYPPLNDIEVFLIQNDVVLQRAKLGSLQRFESRPLLSRSHSVPLELKSGQAYELMIRVETRGAMILPITLEKQNTFHSTAVAEQMVQGLLVGVALCLLMYSLGQWVNSREPLFLKYALLVSGSLLFTLLLMGVGSQYVWTNNFWLEQHMSGLSSAMAIGGTFLFLEESLREQGRSPWFPRIRKVGAVLALVLGLVYALDLIDTRVLSIIITVFGPMPSLICMPRFIERVRRGEAVGIYLLLAWTAYMVAVITITAV